MVGAEASVIPLDVPQTPFTGGGKSCPAQEAVVPPFDPAQLQVQGPVPLTEVASPAEQRFMAGAVETVVPLALPHEPLTGVTVVGAMAKPLKVAPTPVKNAELPALSLIVLLVGTLTAVIPRLDVAVSGELTT